MASTPMRPSVILATMKQDRIVLVLSRRQLKFGLAAVLLATAAWAGTETLTLVGSYPSPLGIYRSIVSAGNAILARDGGRVGIGTMDPASKLDVVGDSRFSAAVAVGANLTAAGAVQGQTLVSGGSLQLGPLPDRPAAANGKVIFNSTNNRLEYSRGNAWFPAAFPMAKNVDRVVACGGSPITAALGTHVLCMVVGASKAAYLLSGAPDAAWSLRCASDSASSLFQLRSQTDGAVAVMCLDFVGTFVRPPVRGDRPLELFDPGRGGGVPPPDIPEDRDPVPPPGTPTPDPLFDPVRGETAP